MRKWLGAALFALAGFCFASQNSTTVPTSGTVTGLQMANAINNAIDTVASNFSGSTNPGAVGPYRLWADTGSGYLRQRDASNANWVALAPLLTPLATTNAASLTSGTVSTARLPVAGTSGPGIVQLTHDLSSTSTTTAATAGAATIAYNTGATAQSTANAAQGTANAAYSLAASKGVSHSGSIGNGGWWNDNDTGLKIRFGRINFGDVFNTSAATINYASLSGVLGVHISVDDANATGASVMCNTESLTLSSFVIRCGETLSRVQNATISWLIIGY